MLVNKFFQTWLLIAWQLTAANQSEAMSENFMLVDKYFQTRLLTGWQHSRQLISSHVRKPSFTNMEFSQQTKPRSS